MWNRLKEIMKIIVQLRAAKIPIIGLIAVHYWYVIIRENQQDRWEIWQTPHVSQHSWGHLHKNLLSPFSGVGNGNSWLANSWTNELGNQLAETIEKSPIIYPYNHCYRYFPGPNSNTYVRWVLNQTECDYSLSVKAIGQYY